LVTRKIAPQCTQPVPQGHSYSSNGLRGFQRTRHCRRDSRPLVCLFLELELSRLGETVKLGSPAVLRFTPGGGQPSGLFHAVQRRKQGSRLYLERSARNLRDPARDRKAVQRLEFQNLQDQH